MADHRLLIIEDDEALRYALTGIFRHMGWRVCAAATVAEGLALLDSEPEPCCVLTDLELPDGDGERIVERVRAKGLKSHVIVATGMMPGPRLSALAALEPDAVLAKPITPEQIWGGICRVCGSE